MLEGGSWGAVVAAAMVVQVRIVAYLRGKCTFLLTQVAINKANANVVRCVYPKTPHPDRETHCENLLKSARVNKPLLFSVTALALEMYTVSL